MKFDIETLSLIFRNELFEIKDEDQLLHFINSLYLKDKKYSILYSYVIFQNVELKTMNEFVDIFDINDINSYTWNSISQRLLQEIKINLTNNKRYKTNTEKNNDDDEKEKGKVFSYSKEKVWDGILNYLCKKSNGEIDNEIKITASSNRDNDLPKNVTNYEDDLSYFYSLNQSNSFLCFDFNKYKVIITDYTIKSKDSSYNPKSWVIEASNNQETWEIIDSQDDFQGLRDSNQICTFKISNNIISLYKDPPNRKNME